MSVIQGILGPILFLVYIDDLSYFWRLSYLLTTPKDLMAGKNLPELIDKVNLELRKVAQWFPSNCQSTRAKTKFLIFHSQAKKNNDLEIKL